MRVFCIVLLALDCSFSAQGKPEQSGKPVNPEKVKVDVGQKKVSVDTGKKDTKGKAIVREFPTMFDIALRSKDHKSQKQQKAKAGKTKQ